MDRGGTLAQDLQVQRYRAGEETSDRITGLVGLG